MIGSPRADFHHGQGRDPTNRPKTRLQSNSMLGMKGSEQTARDGIRSHLREESRHGLLDREPGDFGDLPGMRDYHSEQNSPDNREHEEHWLSGTWRAAPKREPVRET